MNNHNANGKGKVRSDSAADVQFMRTRCEALIRICLEEGGMNDNQLRGGLWGDVCRERWDNFAQMCVYAWYTDWLSRGR